MCNGIFLELQLTDFAEYKRFPTLIVVKAINCASYRVTPSIDLIGSFNIKQTVPMPGLGDNFNVTATGSAGVLFCPEKPRKTSTVKYGSVNSHI